MSRVFRFLVKSVLVLLFLLIVLAGLAAWRLSSETLTSRNWTPTIESFFERLAPDSDAHIGQSSVNWDHQTLSIAIVCTDITLRDARGQTMISFPKASLTLGLWSFLRGRVVPENFAADQAHFRLVRSHEGVLALGQRASAPGLSHKAEKDWIDLFLFLQQIADELAHEGLSHQIAIKNLSVTLHDETAAQDWHLSVPEVRLDHKARQATGTARVILTEGGQQSSLQLDYSYERENALHNVKASFQDIRLASFRIFAPELPFWTMTDIPVSGSFSVRTDRTLDIASAALSLKGGKGVINAPTVWEKPRTLESAVLSVAYGREKGLLEVTEANVDFGGPSLAVTLRVQTPTMRNALWQNRNGETNAFTLNVTLKNLPMDSFATVWPKPVVPNARDWIQAHIANGLFQEGHATVNGRFKLDDIENMTLESGSGTISAKGGRVTYLDGMPAIDDVDAMATFDLDSMDVQIAKGHTGDIRLSPFTIRMTDFQKSVQYIEIPAALKGPVKDVLALLDAPPLGYAKAVGLDAQDSAGTVEGVLTLRMPMLQDLLLKDVEVSAKAIIDGFAAAKLIPSIALSRSKLALDLSQDGFGLDGDLALNGVPAKVTWKTRFTSDPKQKIPTNEALVKARVKDDQWNAFYGLGTYMTARGETPVEVRYTDFGQGKSTVSLQAALTQTALDVPMVGWRKDKGVSASLAFTLAQEKDKPSRIDPILLQGTGLKVNGSATLEEKTGKLASLTLNPFTLGRSQATVSYDAADAGTLRVKGAALDLSGINEKSPEATAPTTAIPEALPAPSDKIEPFSLSLSLGKLWMAPDGFLSNVTGTARRSERGWENIDLYGLAQGQDPLTIQLKPEGGVKTLKVHSDNFGAALQGLGFGQSVKGGALRIEGESKPADPYAIDGHLKITSFSVKDMPILARLLSAVSPFGLVDLITGEAGFDRVLGDFTWSPKTVEFKNVRAVGSVAGINLDGRIHTDTNVAALTGTLVPFSFMNSIISSIPLIGDVITGGKDGGVIAASFTIKGPLGNPDVSVNPVSLLTPGFLRNIFFAGEGEVAEDEPETKDKE